MVGYWEVMPSYFCSKPSFTHSFKVSATLDCNAYLLSKVKVRSGEQGVEQGRGKDRERERSKG